MALSACAMASAALRPPLPRAAGEGQPSSWMIRDPRTARTLGTLFLGPIAALGVRHSPALRLTCPAAGTAGRAGRQGTRAKAAENEASIAEAAKGRNPCGASSYLVRSRGCTCGRGGRGPLIAWGAGTRALVLARAASASGMSAAHLEELRRIAGEKLRARGLRPHWRDELYAALLDMVLKNHEAQVMPLKAELFQDLKDRASHHAASSPGAPFRVMELGVGGGPNLKYYASPHVEVVGVDPNAASESYAHRAADAAGLQPGQFKFEVAAGEGVPLDDASVEAVVGTLVLCSVEDVAGTLLEVARVLKPGGSFYFLEHVAAPAGTALRTVQALLDPVQQALFDGCHLQRDPKEAMERNGFSVDAKYVYIENLGITQYVGTHLIGHAVKTE